MATLTLYPDSANAQVVDLDQPTMLIGSGADAAIQLADASVKECHARIEHRPDGYYLISLVNPPAVFVNGVEVTFQRLNSGDAIAIGAVGGLFAMPDDAGRAEERPAVEEVTEAWNRPGSSTALAIQPQSVSVCPRCGHHMEPGARACAQCGLNVSNLPAMPMDYIPPTPISQSGAGILPIIALLGALTVVGAPVGLVLGLMSLVIIRRKGGTARDYRMAQWSIGLGLLWIMLAMLALGGAVWKGHRREQLNRADVNETKVIRALKNLACAQKYTHTIEYCDTDGDGNSEYGDLAVLAETQSPFFDADLVDGEAYGYRFSVREASEGSFLAVAQPLVHNRTGKRTFAIDQTGQIRGGETEGETFSQIASVLPILHGERSAYYRLDDEIAKDVLNYAQSLSSSPEDQEKKRRILMRVRKEFALTTVGRELEGMEDSVDRAVTENRAQVLYWEAEQALEEGEQDVALAKLQEIEDQYPSFSKIASVERELATLRSTIAQQREQEAQALFDQAEELERSGAAQLEVQQLYQQIEKLYPDTEVAERIAALKPELKRQFRESNAKAIFSELMELSPENDYEMILSQANQFRRNYNDTDLYAKVESELNEKERSARANSWRFRTEQSIAAGRMRGALAELEAAIRENPDLQYDLRDLCIRLYRSAAEQLMKEGDARGALTYYTRLDRVLKVSKSEEEVSPELLAKLHYKVGQVDYESRKFKAARWHLDNAAWFYPDDAQFHMQLGVARMYSGLYRSADAALAQALTLQPDMEQALLYRAYLNLRTVQACDRAIADVLNLEVSSLQDLFGQDEAADGAGADESGEMTESYLRAEAILFGTADSSSAGDPAAYGSGYDVASKRVPEPTDLDLVIRFDPETSRQLLSDLLQLLQKLQVSSEEALRAISQAPNTESRNAAKLGHLLMVTDFRNELSTLRALHNDDVAAQQMMRSMITDMKERTISAVIDIQTVGRRQPRIRPLAERLLPQVKPKARHLVTISELLTENMTQEIEIRELIFSLADRILREITPSDSTSVDISNKIQTRLSDPDSIADIGQLLVMLRQSMEDRLDLDDLLEAAEGNAVATASAR
jgi:hypothetical protein